MGDTPVPGFDQMIDGGICTVVVVHNHLAGVNIIADTVEKYDGNLASLQHFKMIKVLGGLEKPSPPKWMENLKLLQTFAVSFASLIKILKICQQKKI